MLLSPFLDKTFKPYLLARNNFQINIFLFFLTIFISYTGYTAGYITIELILYTLIIAATAEEWFFRVYFQSHLITLLSIRLSKKASGITGIVISSLLFSALHAISLNNIHFIYLVFFPSIFYGYIYLKTKDFILIVNLHFISNIFLYACTT